MSSCSAAVLPGETGPMHADKSGKSPGAVAVDFLFPVSSLRSQRASMSVCYPSLQRNFGLLPASHVHGRNGICH